MATGEAARSQGSRGRRPGSRRRGERAAREKAAPRPAAEEEEEAAGAAHKAEAGAEEHQCSGLLELDLATLCARAGIVPAPAVTPRCRPASPEPSDAGSLERLLARIHARYRYFQPRVQLEMEPEEPRSARRLFVRGWRIEENMLGILSKCLPALGSLQAVHLWRVGLTDALVPTLLDVLTSCPGVRTLSLEANPLPAHSFHKLLALESTLAHLSLRHNDIDDEGARLIAQSLARRAASTRGLVSLSLAFNRITDAGAGHLADALRFNRCLLSLSLSHNGIGDAGALRLAEVLAPFVLTHAELVERRWLLLKEVPGQAHTETGARRSPLAWATELQRHEGGRGERGAASQAGSAPERVPAAKQNRAAPKKKVQEQQRKDEKGQPVGSGGPTAAPARRDDPKQGRKAPVEPKAKAKGAKAGARDKRSPVLDMEAAAAAPPEEPSALLEAAEHRDGQVFVPGNQELLNLNLAYNRITERGLEAFVALLQQEPRPLRVALQNNLFAASCPASVRLCELLWLRDPLRRHRGDVEQGPGA